jgi:hypothetical protein
MTEWQQKLNSATGAPYTEAEADHKMCQDVFGFGYKIDERGFPIETGLGSKANPSDESSRVMAAEKQAAEDAKRRLGWHRGLEKAFDPRSAA